MNKTLTINISGIIFNIEEDAYETLKNYLSNIKRHFQNEEGCEEIVSDIESRLAELLKAKTNAGKQVLVNSDVNEAIDVMGRPEDFVETSPGNENKEENNSSQGHYTNKRRRVFRDPDNKVLGGVCSGVANYFDTDPLWIRLVLVVMFFGFGSGFLLYIILWIIIPQAKTTAEKLEMRGEPIDVNTISKTVKDEAENIRNRAKEYGKEMKGRFSKRHDGINRFADFLHSVFYGLINIIAKIIGVFFVLFGILLFVGLLSVLIGFGTIDNLSINEFINSFAGPDFHTFWFKTGLVLALGIPFCMFVYKGMKMILGIKFYNRWLNISAGVLWLVGITITFYIGVSFARQFEENSMLKQQVDARWPSKDTLYIRSNRNYIKTDTDVEFGMHRDRWFINSTGTPSVWWGKPRVKIVTSENDSLYVFVMRMADGFDKKEAALRAKNINYKLQQADSVLLLDKYFSFNSSEKFRNQEVQVVVKMPKNKIVFLDNSLRNLWYDIENTNGIIDSEMGGKYWKMTENGLTCLNCPKQATDSLKFSKHINLKDANIKIDENGIKIKSSDGDVKIDEDGIKIKSRTKDKDENED
jgi:phage shock protein PspC (stress-responsive transcriptional regulator)